MEKNGDWRIWRREREEQKGERTNENGGEGEKWGR